MARICLHCRARIDADHCDLSNEHTVLDLEVSADRERFELALWEGAPPVRLISVTRWLIGGVWVAFFAAAILLDAHEPIGLLTVLLLSASLFTLSLSRLLKHGVTLEVQAPWAPRFPVGVNDETPLLRDGVSGTVRGDPVAISPMGKRSCVAWGLLLERSWAEEGSILFTDGATSGFVLEPSDGAPVRVPKGRVRIAFLSIAREKEETLVVKSSRTLERVRRETTGGNPALVPAKRGVEVIVVPGDRIMLCSPTEDEHVPGEGYRQGSWRRVATGVPVLMLDS